MPRGPWSRPLLSPALSGSSAALGGLLWLVHTMLLASRPLGCVGDACFEGLRRHRDSEDLAWLMLLSVLLLAVSVGTSLRRDARRSLFLSASLVLLGLGAALLLLGLIVNRGSSDGAPLWWLHDSDTLGRILPVLGTLTAGIAILREGPHRWLGALFIAAAAASFLVNIQDERALLGAPVGVAWLAYGVLGLLRARAGREPRAAPSDAAGAPRLR